MTRTSALREDTLVAAMLSIRLPDDGGLRPLTQSQFRQTADTLHKAGNTLADILTLPNPVLASLIPKAALLDKIVALRQRFRAITDAVEAWADRGIWVLGEADAGYPDKLRRRLAGARPPLLFGSGPNGSLDAGGICIVGSRNSSDAAISFTQTLAARCAQEKLAVISSDMRGVDRAAIQVATENGGRALMILSDKLEKTHVHPRFAKALADQTLTMVTPFAPDIGFSVGNAVRANRYQYALSDLTVIAETRPKGGIWQGAEENRKGNWAPAFVRSGPAIPPGNRALLHLGLPPITHDQIRDARKVSKLFLDLRTRRGLQSADRSAQHPSAARALFRLFQTELELIAKQPVSTTEITAHFGITPDQTVAWLAQTVESGTVHPVADAKDLWVASGH